MRQEPKFTGMKLKDSLVYMAVLNKAYRIGHAGLVAQVEALRGASRSRLIQAKSVLESVDFEPEKHDIDKVTI